MDKKIDFIPIRLLDKYGHLSRGELMEALDRLENERMHRELEEYERRRQRIEIINDGEYIIRSKR